MELAESWAVEQYERDLANRHGDAHLRMGEAALRLSKNPQDSDAHKEYFEAIRRLCGAGSV